MIKIFDYQDYREYLQAYYDEQKATLKSFSYRSFSKKANINTSSFLYHVIEGKKNLTKSSIVKVSGAIGHTKDEADYFEHLVFFNQSKTIQEKTYYYSKIIESKRPLDIENVEKSRFEFYNEWYHSVIRELVCFVDFQGDFISLGKMLIPQINEKDVKNSLALLESLGFIEKDEFGKYRQTKVIINTKPSPIEVLIVQKFQIKMAELAVKAYDSASLHERMGTSTTFSISEKTYDLIKMRAREFQRDIMEIAKIESEQDRVYQMTLNIFPVSRSVKHEKK